MTSKISQDRKHTPRNGIDESSAENVTATAAAKPRSQLPFPDRLRHGFFITLILAVLLVFVVLVPTIPLLYFQDKHQGEVLKSMAPAGRVINVTLNDGWVPHSLVETDTGFFAVAGGVSLGKNEPLTLEVRANADRYLCDASHHCTRLF